MAQSSFSAVLDESGYLSDSSLLDSIHSTSLRKQKPIVGLSHASSLMNLSNTQCLHSTPLSPLKRSTHLRKSAYLNHAKLSIIKKPEIKPKRLLMVEESLEGSIESPSLLNESGHSSMADISESNSSHKFIRKSVSISGNVTSTECSRISLSDDSGFDSITLESQDSPKETSRSEIIPTVDCLKTSKTDNCSKLDSSKGITKLKKKLFNLEGKKYFNPKTEKYCSLKSVAVPPECSNSVKQSQNILHSILKHTPGLLISILKLLPPHDLLAFCHVCSAFMLLVRRTKCLQSRIDMLFHNQRVTVGIVGKENFCRPFKIFQPNNSSRMPLANFNQSSSERSTQSLHCPQLQRIRPCLSTKSLPEKSYIQKNLDSFSNFKSYINDTKDEGIKTDARNNMGNASCSSSSGTLNSVHSSNSFLSCFHQAANAIHNAVSPRKSKKISSNKSGKCSVQLMDRFDKENSVSNCHTESHLVLSHDETVDTVVDVKASVGVKKVCAILGDENDLKPQTSAKFRPFSKAAKKKLRRL